MISTCNQNPLNSIPWAPLQPNLRSDLSSYRFDYYSLKLDARFNQDWTNSLRLNQGDVEIEHQAGGLDGGTQFPSADNSQDRKSGLFAWNTSYVGKSFVYESNLQYSKFRWNYGRPASGPGPRVTLLDINGLIAAELGHPGYIFDSKEKTWQLQQKLAITGDQHQFKLGLDLIRADFQLAGGGNVNGNYLVQLDADQQAALLGSNLGAGLTPQDLPYDIRVLAYDVELQPNSFGKAQELYSFYVEDQWQLNARLNLSTGLRYDYDSLSKGGSSSADSNNFAPRLSFNYQLSEREVIRGGYGVFYEKIPYAIYSDALQQNSKGQGFRQQLQQLVNLGILPANTNLDQITFNGNLSVSPENVSYLQGPTPDQVGNLRETSFSNERRILNPKGYDNPYTHQFSLGYQRQISSDWLFYVDLMATHSYNLLRLRDLNAPSSYQISLDQLNATPQALWPTLVRSVAQADATRPVAPLAGGARGIIVSETAGASKYLAASFNLVRDFGDLASYRIAYTLSRLSNNTEDINFRAMDGNDFGAEWGPSINDRTHVISKSSQVKLNSYFSFSLAALIQSGQPINRIPDAALFGTSDLNGDGRSFGDAYVGNSDRQPGEGRNNDRLGWSRQLDLGLVFNQKLLNRDFELRLDVFNLFNSTNLSGYSNNATQSNQIQTGSREEGRFVARNAGPPRQFQLSLRYLF